MKRAWLMLAVLAAVAGCKKKKKGGDPSPSPTVTATPSASPSPSATVAPTPTASAAPADGGDVVVDDDKPALADAKLLDGVTVSKVDIMRDKKMAHVDAAAVGAALEVQLIAKLDKQNGDAREFDLILYLAGSSKLAVQLSTDLGEMGLPEPSELAEGTLVQLAPLPAPRAFDANEDAPGIEVKFPGKDPLIHSHHFTVPGASDILLIAHEKDALVVYYMSLDEEAEGPAKWKKAVHVMLAPGAVVTPK